MFASVLPSYINLVHHIAHIKDLQDVKKILILVYLII